MAVEIKLYQIWEVYSLEEKRWRRVRVGNVLMNEVELTYLDPPETPELWRTFRADRRRMEREPNSYRFIAHSSE
jgi:hypothetical protein